MQQVIFINNKQQLKDVIMKLADFNTLSAILPAQLQLSSRDRLFCQDTFVYPNEEKLLSQMDEKAKSIEQLMQEVVHQLITRNKLNYTQCLGQQYKDCTLTMRYLNFGRTIIQTNPTFRNLFQKIQTNLFFQLLLNYIIIVKYKGQYVQVAGRMLNQQFNMRSLGYKKKIESNGLVGEKGKSKGTVQVKLTPWNHSSTKTHTYSTDTINRFQLFYCSAMNRSTGLFSKNIFFDKGVRKSKYLFQTQKLVSKFIDDKLAPNTGINEQVKASLSVILEQMFEKVRQLFQYREYKGKITSKFDCLLANYCRLPLHYKQLKSRTHDYLNHKQGNTQRLFDDLYDQSCMYQNVHSLLFAVLTKVVPNKLLGSGNHNKFMGMMPEFVSMKRFQNYKIQDFLAIMNVFQLKWLNVKFNKKHMRRIVVRCRKYLSSILTFLLNDFIVPLLKYNFYITQRHKQANKIFYYRKPIWTLVSKLALKKFTEDNLQAVSDKKVAGMKKDLSQMYPEGKLRILPKKGTFRPIITFNRKVQFGVEYSPNIRIKATLNQILSDTQLVLRNLKNILGQQMGYCIFDNNQIMTKYDAFVYKWRSMGCPPLKYFTLDIRKCYDSINTNQLMKFIQESRYIEEDYLIVKYCRLYRNKKALNVVDKRKSFNNFFNYKERVAALPFKNDLMQIHEQNIIPSINIFPAKQRLVTKQSIIKKLRRICTGSIVNYNKNYWLQKVGIPQGLNVSGVLCSLYFANLEARFVKVDYGLLMRLTDDYLYIGPQKEANEVLDNLLVCAKNNGFQFSQNKISKNFHHPTLLNYTQDKQILWIGKKINIDTLEISPNFELSQKLSYAMNVNMNKKSLKPFMKNKLKSLLTNHFSAYFKPKIFCQAHLMKNVRLYVMISLQKYFPFLLALRKMKIANFQHTVIKIFKSTMHEFIVFACMLAGNREGRVFYDRLYVQVSDEIVEFFNRRTSYREFMSIRNIFRADAERLRVKYGIAEPPPTPKYVNKPRKNKTSHAQS